MGYIITIGILLFAFFLFSFIENKSKDRNNKRIEQTVNYISKYVYNRDEFYSQISYMNLKREESINENGKKVIFYDSIDYEKEQFHRNIMKENVKKRGFINLLNKEYFVKSICIEFNIVGTTIRNIHMFFNDLSQNKFAYEFIQQKFNDIEKINNENIEKAKNKEEYPWITLQMEYYPISLGIYYESHAKTLSLNSPA